MKKYTRNDSQYIRNRKQLLATSPACHYCSRPANTVDHIVELDRWNTENLPGSPHTLDNMVPACRSCNSSRGASYGNSKRAAATKARNAGMAKSAKQRAKQRPPAKQPTQSDDSPRGILGVPDEHPEPFLFPLSENKQPTPPRLKTPSHGGDSYGQLVVDWADRILGRTLYPWQIEVLHGILEHDADGKLRHRHALTSTARQAGKTLALQSLIGWWLTEGKIIRGEPQSVLSVAHELRAAEEIHYVLAPILEERFGAAKSYASFGRKEVRWDDGTIWRIASATPAAGHGQSNDLLIVDELWDVDSDVLHNGLLPTQRARPNPLAAFFSTAGTEKSHAFLRWREAGLDLIDKGEPGRLFMAEWSPPPNVDLSDRRYWIMGNPSIGYGHLTLQDLEDEAQGPNHSAFLRAGLNLWVASDQSWLEPGEWEKLKTDGPPPDWTVLTVDSSHDGSRFVGLLGGIDDSGVVHITTAFVTHSETEAWQQVRDILPAAGLLAITPSLDIHAPPEYEKRKTTVGHGELVRWTGIVRGMIREQKVAHYGQTTLSEHVGRAVSYQSRAGMGLSSEKSPGPIELARCLVWTVALCSKAKYAGKPAIGGARKR